jgi:hypothetical protein
MAFTHLVRDRNDLFFGKTLLYHPLKQLKLAMQRQQPLISKNLCLA